MYQINFKYRKKMKRMIKSLKQGISTVIMALAASICVAALVFACKDNDKTDNVTGGGANTNVNEYSIEYFSGFHKIKFRWKANANIGSATIYWSQRSKSETVTVTSAEWQEVQLNDMEEDSYLFEFVMQDKSGKQLPVVNISASVLGDKYIESLPVREAIIEKPETGDLTVVWSAVTSATLQHSIIEYDNGTGNMVSKDVPNTEGRTVIPRTSSNISIYGVHFPGRGLENLNSLKKRLYMPKNPRLLDKSLFEAFFMPGDNTTPEPGNSDDAWKNPLPENIDTRDIRALWDGNIRNDARPDGPAMRGILHTADQSNDWANARFKYPHCFTFSIGTMAYLTNLKLHGRGDAGAFTGHSPRYFEVWVTNNPKMREDFESDAAFEQYYRTTYVNHRAVDNQIQTNPNGNSAYTGQEYIATYTAGIYNWQEDWIKVGDFENKKPSGLNYNSANDDDRAVWGNNSADLDIMSCGFNHELTDVDTKVKYIRLVIKYPNWQHTNCINIGEVTFWGDDL